MRKAYSLHQVAHIFNVDYHTVWRWVKAGRLPAYRTPGKQWRVSSETIERFQSAAEPTGPVCPAVPVYIGGPHRSGDSCRHQTVAETAEMRARRFVRSARMVGVVVMPILPHGITMGLESNRSIGLPESMAKELAMDIGLRSCRAALFPTDDPSRLTPEQVREMTKAVNWGVKVLSEERPREALAAIVGLVNRV